MSTILTDRCMGRSFTQAVISDAPLLRDSIAEENAAATDRALAHRLAGIATPTVTPEQRIVGDALDESYMARLAALYVSGEEDEGDASVNTTGDTNEAAEESSASAASRHRPSYRGSSSMHRMRLDEATSEYISNTLWTSLLPGVLTDSL